MPEWFLKPCNSTSPCRCAIENKLKNHFVITFVMIFQFLNNCDISFSLLQVLHYELMKFHHRHRNEEEHIRNDFLFSFFASFVQF